MTTSIVTSQTWATTIRLADAAARELVLSPEHGTAQLPLITRTGFEQRHIVTSQIGSL